MTSNDCTRRPIKPRVDLSVQNTLTRCTIAQSIYKHGEQTVQRFREMISATVSETPALSAALPRVIIRQHEC